MKRFKQFEAYSNIALYMLLLILFLTKNIEFYYAYLIMGGWQVLGMISHAVNGWFMSKTGFRNYYQWTVIVIFLLFGLGVLFPPLALFILYILLFTAPVMALIYIGLCFSELRTLNSRKNFTLSN